MSAATRLRHFSTGSASFVVTFPVDDLELATSWTQTALSGTSIRSRSTLSWPARRSAITAFPALIPRPTLVRDAVAARVGEEGPAYMFYTGCTIADTPVSPAADELAPAAAMRAPTEDEKQVLDGLTKRYRDLDTAHTAAAATGSLVAVVKAVREARSERIVTEQELAQLDPVNDELISFARDPFVRLPPHTPRTSPPYQWTRSTKLLPACPRVWSGMSAR